MEITFERIAFSREVEDDKRSHFRYSVGKTNYEYLIVGNKLKLEIYGKLYFGEQLGKYATEILYFDFDKHGLVKSPPKIYSHPSWTDFIIVVVTKHEYPHGYGDVYKIERKTLNLLQKVSLGFFEYETQVGEYFFAPVVHRDSEYDYCEIHFAHRFNPKTMKIDGVIDFGETLHGVTDFREALEGVRFAGWEDWFLVAWTDDKTVRLTCYDVEGEEAGKQQIPIVKLEEGNNEPVKIRLVTGKRFIGPTFFLEICGDIGTKFIIQLEKNDAGKKSPARAVSKKSPARAVSKKSPVKRVSER